MKEKPTRLLLAVTAICGVLILSVQPATAFELFARRLGGDAAQKCDACQKGASQKGACQKGACQKGACQKGACQKGVVQKGGKGKGSVGTYGEGFDKSPDYEAPAPPAISPQTSA